MPKPLKTSRQVRALTNYAIAACSMELGADRREMQLMPAGAFCARDGRPANLPAPYTAPHWYLDAALATVLIDAANARITPYVIDYDHQTMLAAKNGQPAPAAGWFKTLEWREGVGLFAIDVEWTERASTMIATKEYRFISPVMAYNKTGAVTGLCMAALANNPAIDGMDEVLLAAASMQFTPPESTVSLTTENHMEELLEQLRWMFNLPVGSTADDICNQMKKLTDLIKQDPAMAACASVGQFGLYSGLQEKIAALSTAAPDPTKFVSIETMAALQSHIASLSGQTAADKVDELVKAGLKDGRLLPAQEKWARDCGASSFAALSTYMESATPLAILNGTQTQGKNLDGGSSTVSLSASQAGLAKAFGLAPADFLATLNAESQG